MIDIATPAGLRDHLGTELGVSDWVPVDQDRVDRFAAVTEDWQWIHVDPARAAVEAPLGKTVAHGFLTLSLLSRFVNAVVRVQATPSIISVGLSSVRFISPVTVGSNVRGRVRLRELSDEPGFVQAVWRVTIEVEGGRLFCCVADWTVRYAG